MNPPHGPEDYQIAILCALGTESDAVGAIFDEVYPTNTLLWQKAEGDQNSYTAGRVGQNYVVLAFMPGIGKINAATTASCLNTTFRNISLALVVGLCGGAPQTAEGTDIYLGDVIVSTQVHQGDLGRESINGFTLKSRSEGNTNLPLSGIRSFLTELQRPLACSNLQEKTTIYTEEILSSLELEAPPPHTDVLFAADYTHKHHRPQYSTTCITCTASEAALCPQSQKMNCTQLGCETAFVKRQRSTDAAHGPNIIFGPVSSTDTVRKNGVSRDKYIEQHGVIAFEMEGAGVWEVLPTIIVKAVCDYADSHKNKSWQRYAAVTAAACCKAMLEDWTVTSRPIEFQRLGMDSIPQQHWRREYLASLNYELLDDRLHDIEFASAGACDWIFKSTEFITWLDVQHRDVHNGVLQVRGKPGSGKSTMMKHMYIAGEEYFREKTVAAYFFHARGGDLQKTLIGMFRSITYQILRNNVELLDRFIPTFPTASIQHLKNRDWTVKQLQHFLLLSIQQKVLDKTVIIIDAVDECDHSDARKLVEFCEKLAVAATSSGLNVSILLSTRKFPHISMRACIGLDIDRKKGHNAAIEQYVMENVRVQDPKIVRGVVVKAQHVFAWAVLVVQVLNESFDGGAAIGYMLDQLSTISPNLYGILDSKFQNGEALNDEIMLMFRLVLYAYHPLHPGTLYLLMKAGTKLALLSSWSTSGMDDESVQLFIIRLSRGMLEIVPRSPEYDLNHTNRPSSNTKGMAAAWWPRVDACFQSQLVVQFVHESVRDSLLGNNGLCQSQVPAILGTEVVCHEAIAEVCISSLSIMTAPSTWEDLKDYPHIIHALAHSLMYLEGARGKEGFESLVNRYVDSLVGWKFLLLDASYDERQPAQLGDWSSDVFPLHVIMNSGICK